MQIVIKIDSEAKSLRETLSLSAPPELLTRAAALGAIDAGPAPREAVTSGTDTPREATPASGQDGPAMDAGPAPVGRDEAAGDDAPNPLQE